MQYQIESLLSLYLILLNLFWKSILFQLQELFATSNNNGNKSIPTYAILVMGFLERRLYQEVENNFEVEFAREFELSWKIYLDDCFIILNKLDEELFSDILNNLRASIKFTKDEHIIQFQFLDILIITKLNKLKQI